MPAIGQPTKEDVLRCKTNRSRDAHIKMPSSTVGAYNIKTEETAMTNILKQPLCRRAALLLAAALVVLPGAAGAADWKPVRPINLIVPWAAGGSTDQVTRIVAAELEKSLGQTIVIINQPGASGAIGTASALDAAKDGYTWTSGAAQDLGAYETLGSVKTRITDWNLFLSVANLPVLAVNANSPYQTAKQLLDAMKASPEKISVATAGLTSTGHMAMELVAKAAGVKYRHVSYDGGNPAVVATVSGETDVTSQLGVEEVDMIRGKRLHPLATIGDKPLTIDGYGTIPPLSDTLPGFTAPALYFGIFLPKGVPDDLIQTLQKLWADNIAKNDALKQYANSRGALFAPLSGEAAQKAAFPAVQANAWLLFNSGKAKTSPDTVGIPAP
jgi:tripartite-type tricarboxylate transporter receptor subunit TctC